MKLVPVILLCGYALAACGSDVARARMAHDACAAAGLDINSDAFDNCVAKKNGLSVGSAQSAQSSSALSDMSMRLMAAGQRLTPAQRAAVLSGTPMPAEPTYTAPPAPRMRTTNCSALGNTLNCTTF